MDKIKWLIFGAVCIAILVGVFFISRGDSAVDVSNIDQAKIHTSNNFSENDNVFGNKNAKVVLVQYGDFQCPGCGAVYPTVKELTEKYKNDIAFVFRNLPLTNIHPNALAAATAAETVAKQGKFFEMHNALYENQSAWENADVNQRDKIFESYAQQVGADINRYHTDVSNPDITRKINWDRALAKKAGVDSTPTFYLNGSKLGQDTWSNKTKFEAAITNALKAAGVTPTPTAPQQ